MPQKIIWHTMTEDMREMAIELRAEECGDYFEPILEAMVPSSDDPTGFIGWTEKAAPDMA